jgi:hypothetical protein
MLFVTSLINGARLGAHFTVGEVSQVSDDRSIYDLISIPFMARVPDESTFDVPYVISKFAVAGFPRDYKSSAHPSQSVLRLEESIGRLLSVTQTHSSTAENFSKIIRILSIEMPMMALPSAPSHERQKYTESLGKYYSFLLSTISAHTNIDDDQARDLSRRISSYYRPAQMSGQERALTAGLDPYKRVNALVKDFLDKIMIYRDLNGSAKGRCVNRRIGETNHRSANSGRSKMPTPSLYSKGY